MECESRFFNTQTSMDYGAYFTHAWDITQYILSTTVQLTVDNSPFYDHHFEIQDGGPLLLLSHI